MIRINLLKNRGDSNRSVAGTSVTEINYDSSYQEVATDAFNPETRGAIVKIVLMLLGVGLLMVYESYNISSLRSEIAITTTTKAKYNAEITQKKPLADKAKEYQKKVTELETRIKSIKDLSRYRLREIKSIDYIQNIIPEKIWLSNLDFKDGALKIEGYSGTDDDLNKFIESIESKSYFSDVILMKAVEEKRKDGVVKTFQINSNLATVD